MRTIFVEKDTLNDGIIKVSDKNEINHVKNVLRSKLGERIRVINGEKAYITEIIQIEKKEIELKVISEICEESNNCKVEIGLTILKNDKMDMAIQKLTEIGVDTITPILTDRSVVKLKEKKERWDKISIEALKQCRGIKFVEIKEPIAVRKIDFSYYDKVIIFHPGTEKKIRDIINVTDEKILYLIGPEGGFTDGEIEYFVENGAIAVNLGKRILRAETAAIVAGGLILNEVR